MTSIVEMLDSYTDFSRRVNRVYKKDEERLLLLADMIEKIQEVGGSNLLIQRQSTVYWPTEPIVYTPPSCLDRESVFFEDDKMVFAVLATKHTRKVCQFSPEHLIPSSFVRSLFQEIRIRCRQPSPPPPSIIRASYTREAVPPSTTGSEYPHSYNNNDFATGNGLAGPIGGKFRLEMRYLKGIVGVTPVDTNTPYSIIVSSAVIISVAKDSLDSSLRSTEITLYGAASDTTTTIPYCELQRGFALRHLTHGNETVQCRVTSNDSLVFSYREYDREQNTLLVESPCQCLCNVDYALYTLSYTSETMLPLCMHIEMGDMARIICDSRSAERAASYAATVGYSNIRAKPSNRVNDVFEDRGSMETYFDTIDLLTRLKMMEKKDSPVPEFFLMDTALSVRQLRRGVSSPAERQHDRPLCTPSLFPASPLLWSIFYNSRALALFSVSGRHVSITPILPGEVFEIVSYVVY